MSFRELRNFCEQMRALGYPRIVSIENFRRPNFELVADILYWLAQKYDPHVEISDNIDEERHRVEFIKQICTLFISKARLRVNPRKIYQADGYAVQEILKISTFLYKAQSSMPAEEDELHEFNLPAKLVNVKAHKVLVQEITELGAKLYDQLGKENELRGARERALNFLDSVSRNVDSKAEQGYITKCIDGILQQQEENISEMNKYVQNLEKDQRTLEEKIKRRTRELEQAEKRLKGMTSVKPAFQEEYERLEIELERIYQVISHFPINYQIYIEKFRNLDYLEHQLDMWNQKESENVEQMEKRRKKIKKKIDDEEMEILRGDKDIDESLLEAQMNGKQDTRIASSNIPKREVQKMQQGQNFYKGGDEEDDDINELEGDEDEEEEEGDIDDLDDEEEDEDGGPDDDEF